ncbi:MAG: hypothetical protein ABSD64_04380 [Terriglobales bacterium]|jgi:hypothetical protein
MAKLNGWKRIGIIASVVWILGAGAYTYDSEIEVASLRISEAHVSCDSAAKAPLTVTPPPGYTLESSSKAPDFFPDPGTVPMPPGAVPADSGDCHKQAEDSLALAVKNARLDASLVALVPVPLCWLFTYLVLFLVRWVKRGFMQPL